MFLIFLAHELQSLSSHHRLGSRRQAERGLEVTRTRARGGDPGLWLSVKKCRALRVRKSRCVLCIFSVIIRAWTSQEIMKGIYFYFKIGKMAHLFKKKLVLSIARHLSLSRLPLMKTMQTVAIWRAPCVQSPVLGMWGKRKTWQTQSLPSRFLKFHGCGGRGGTNKHHAEVIKIFVSGRKQP